MFTFPPSVSFSTAVTSFWLLDPRAYEKWVRTARSILLAHARLRASVRTYLRTCESACLHACVHIILSNDHLTMHTSDFTEILACASAPPWCVHVHVCCVYMHVVCVYGVWIPHINYLTFFSEFEWRMMKTPHEPAEDNNDNNAVICRSALNSLLPTKSGKISSYRAKCK